MGKFLKINKLTTLAESLILFVGISVILGAVYYIAPGIRVGQAVTVESIEVSKDTLDNVTKSEMLPLPSKAVSTKVVSKPLYRIAEYGWNGNSGMIIANGGPRTTKGSLLESKGINLEIVRLDMVDALREMQLKFVDEYANGTEFPKSEKSAFAVSIMGDGVPFYITSLQYMIDQKFGVGKYHVRAVGSYGLSFGEDKLIGPAEWKENPQQLRGSLICAVIGDGDWVVVVNYAAANNIPINPDPSTYDPNAINIVPAPQYDYIEAVKELIKSQSQNYTVELKEVVDGKLTGKTVNKKIDGVATWTPGDQIAFDALVGYTDIASTREFVNQMATTLVVVDEWARAHEKDVIALLSATYTATNQFKQYEAWRVAASEAVYETYQQFSPKFWYDMFKGQTVVKGGVSVNLGGTKVFTYGDALQYYGITDGNNRYRVVYNQVSQYLTSLNADGFNETYPNGAVAYDDAVNLYYLKSVSDVEAGKTETYDYTEKKVHVMAEGHWNINFETGSANISGSKKDLETIYSVLVQAESSKLSVVGHTDNTGSDEVNVRLSNARAQSVVDYLVKRGINPERIQEVDGRGSKEPIANNSTSSGRALNRRVDVTLLN